MDDGHCDRRALRTRRLLQEALAALVREKGYEAITVQDVLDRADVGRATFYAHFPNKQALLLSVFAALRDALHKEIAGLDPVAAARLAEGEGVGVFEPLFAHAAQHRDLYRVLLSSREGAVLLRYLRTALAVPMREHLEARSAAVGTAATLDVGFVVAAAVSAVLGVLVWWLEQDAAYSPATMNRMVEQLLALGVAGTFAGAGGHQTGVQAARMAEASL
jgi:AcrR family transcriptional regulator